MRRLSGASPLTGADELRSEARDGSAVPVDVRRPEEYAAGHIPGAVNLPLADLLSDDSPERVARLAGSLGIGDEGRAVVYDDTFGALASRVAWALEYVGHRDVTLLERTYGAWKSSGLETDSAVPEARPCGHSVRTQGRMLATAEDLESAAGRDGAILIDNRERLNYLEQHIPGAINIPYRTLGDESRILRPAGELARVLANRGVGGKSEAITYCGSVGTLSGLAYYALKSAGVDGVRLYARSFREWKGLSKPTEGQGDANYWDLSAE